MIELTSNRMSWGRRDVGGVGTMPSGEEEGAASGVAWHARVASGAARGSSMMGAASGLL